MYKKFNAKISATFIFINEYSKVIEIGIQI